MIADFCTYQAKSSVRSITTPPAEETEEKTKGRVISAYRQLTSDKQVNNYEGNRQRCKPALQNKAYADGQNYTKLLVYYNINTVS